MSEFPNGFLLMREFSTLTEAHSAASRLASRPSASSKFRLIEVSPTAGGAWVCAYDTNEETDLEAAEVNQTIMDAFLSLGPKLDAETKSIGILEDASIANVFKSALHYTKAGLKLLEIRVKRAGAPGAYAFFAISDGGKISAPASLPAMTTIPLVGDYRRFF